MSAAPVSQPPPRAPLLVKLLRLAVLTFLGLCLLAPLLAFALLAAQTSLAERIVPGVQVAGIDVGGMTRAQASAALAEQYQSLETTRYTFVDGGQAWTATAAELGLSFPAATLVENAFAIGHGADERRSLQEQAQAWFNGAALPLQLKFDEAIAIGYLERLAAAIDRPRQDASLHLDGLQVLVSPGLSGRRLNIPATLVRLAAAVLAQAGDAEIQLVIEEEAPRSGNVDAAADLLRRALSAPLQLVGTRPNGEPLPPWVLTLEQIRAALQVTRYAAGADLHFDVSVDLSPYARFLGTLAPALSSPAIDGRFDFEPTSQTLTATAPSASGRQLNVAETMRRLQAAVFEPVNRRVALVFESLSPRFPSDITAAELGISELVAEATTYFWGSLPNRRSNIALGAGKLAGIIVAPGEEFSFNYHLGDITPEAGFLEGSVILGGATVTGIGGGICQVSTTLFRVAFSGGYAITERNSHGYRVGYYEYNNAGPGLDAAIWQPDVDLRFKNNTPHHLLIESDFLPTQNALQFRFYSTRHWRTQIESAIIRDIVPAPPEKFVAADDLALGQIRQIDYSADGADVRVYRNIYDTEGNLVKRDQAFTHYQPWQAVFEVAPGDPRLPADEEEEGANASESED